ncbi:MAG: hypothetical protein ABI632_11015 [Pseudolysinimonas sp.]
MAATKKRKLGGGLQVGFGLISASAVIAAVGISIATVSTDIVGLRIVILLAVAGGIVALWARAVQNGRAEREARDRLRAEHPGALVERVRLWALPQGRADRGIPIHFIVAEAEEVSFETVDQTVLLRIPVADLGFADLVAAQADRARDKAVTLIYGDEQLTVQFFTITYVGQDKLCDRVRTAIGWPPAGTP